MVSQVQMRDVLNEIHVWNVFCNHMEWWVLLFIVSLHITLWCPVGVKERSQTQTQFQRNSALPVADPDMCEAQFRV